MAIKLENKTNVVAPNSAYPYGDIKDDTGANDGTPVNHQVYADMHQFFEKLVAESTVSHNGLHDNETNGFQLYEALLDIKTQLALVNQKKLNILYGGDYNPF